MIIKSKMWSRLFVTFAALLLGASAVQAQIAVDFGSVDYTTNNAGHVAGALDVETGDFEFGANTTDDSATRQLIEKDFLTIPFVGGATPNKTVTFSAGAQYVNYDSVTSPALTQGNYKWRGLSDALQIYFEPAVATGVSGMAWAPYVKKANFLNGYDDDEFTLSFEDVADSVETTTGGAADMARVLVQNGSAWYVSATSTVGAISLNGSTETWYPYDPSATLFVDESNLGTGVLGSTLTDIQAAGVLTQKLTGAGSQSFYFYSMLLKVEQTARPEAVAVDFGGDYRNGNQNVDRALSYETGDYDLGVAGDDRRGYRAIDSTYITISPSGGTGTPGDSKTFHAGYQIANLGDLTDPPVPGNFKLSNGATLDQLIALSGAGTANMSQAFALHVKKANFLNGFEDTGSTLALDDRADSVSFNLAQLLGGGMARALVQNGSDWYVSDTELTATGLFTVNGYTETWYAYDPSSNLFLDTASLGAGVAGSTLTDVQALGVLIQKLDFDGQVGNASRFGINALSAKVVQTEIPITYGGVYEDNHNTIGLWHMDTLDGVKIDDDDSVSTGRNADLNVNGAVLVDPAGMPLLDYPGGNNSAFGQCVHLDGNDLLSVAYANIPLDTTQFRMEAWVKSEVAADGQMLMDRWGQINIRANIAGFSVQPFTVNASTPTYHANPVGFVATDWNHIAVEVNGETLTIYVNDVLIRTETVSGGLKEPSKASAFFGARYSPSDYFTGYMDELRIFDTGPTLGAQERLSTFDKPLVTVTPTIDGIKTLGEWGDAFELPMLWPDLGVLPNIGSVSLVGLPETEADPADISAVFYFKWDATNLYILAEVTDDVLIPALAVGSAGWPDDHFILGIDPNLADGDADDNIFLAEFFIDSLGDPRHYFRSDLVPGIVDPALNVFTNHEVKGSEVAGGYVIELALNWVDLGVTSPVATDMIGVSILLFDNDVDDGARDVSLNSTGGSIVVPSEYHQVTLAGLQNTFANYIGQYDVGILDQPSDDPDLDGVDNFTEYALGGDPSVSDAPSIQPVGALASQGEDDVFAFTYNRRIGATALGLNYDVKGKTDLTGPTWSIDGITEAETAVLDDEFEAVTATTPMDADNKFLRLEITD